MRVKADCAEPLAQRCCAHQPRRRPTWTTRHPARFKKHADCRPLLQQSLPIRRRVVQPGKRAAFPTAAHLVRLTDRRSSRTAAGAHRRIIRPTPGMQWPQAPTPAASIGHQLNFLSQRPRGLPQGFYFASRHICTNQRTRISAASALGPGVVSAGVDLDPAPQKPEIAFVVRFRHSYGFAIGWMAYCLGERSVIDCPAGATAPSRRGLVSRAPSQHTNP